MGPCTSVVVDTRTGARHEGANGRLDELADPVHPVIQQRYEHVQQLGQDPNNHMHTDHPLAAR